MEEEIISKEIVDSNADPKSYGTDLKSALLTKRQGLRGEINRIDAEASRLQDEYSKKLGQLQSLRKQLEEAIQHVDALLKIEGGIYEPVALTGVKADEPAIAPADIAFGILEEQGKPMHYRDIAAEVKKRGTDLLGKDPAATLLTKLSRDDRFKRISRGTYALSAWKVRKARSKTR
ncbi:MAG: HTH domain-containing protein [Dehalococcoidia bacterium]|nr:HTH domain-containing protein [Dehalococcoidia bacterium]